MSKALIISSLLVFVTACGAQYSKSIIVEFDSTSIKVKGKETDDLLASLNSLEQCENVHLIVDKNSDHKKIVEIMATIKQSKCETVSIQSI
ncbi:hypothetical protein G3R49_07375 [Shewanella sp. WXL01]|uniref:hypothetical protein n=1 Tax=Shewanella sp. WXL01 TaxID=2709721 RepID=UPI0014386621|nr:hypothetical protein [Shewanella sp. WXL01]NKF50395.1 hypothetical protein [Shewanella sp. WXL01]